VHKLKEHPVKRLAAAFALSALAAATVGLAQQATQQTQPPPATSQAPPSSDSSATSQAAPSDPSAGKADKQALMKDCVTQVQAANPNVSLKDIQAYCDDQVKKMTSQPN
jgi:hypothetical protein